MASTSTCSTHTPMCCIIPPDILINISKSDKVSPEARKRAERTLGHIKTIREKRIETLSKKVAARKEGAAPPAAPHGLRRTIYDCHQKGGLPFDRDHDGHVDVNRPRGFPKWEGTKLFGEGHSFSGTSTTNDSAKNVYDFFKATYDLYKNEFDRDSIDGKGLELVGCIHYDEATDPNPGFFNAFWCKLPLLSKGWFDLRIRVSIVAPTTINANRDPQFST